MLRQELIYQFDSTGLMTAGLAVRYFQIYQVNCTCHVDLTGAI